MRLLQAWISYQLSSNSDIITSSVSGHSTHWTCTIKRLIPGDRQPPFRHQSTGLTYGLPQYLLSWNLSRPLFTSVCIFILSAVWRYSITADWYSSTNCHLSTASISSARYSDRPTNLPNWFSPHFLSHFPFQFLHQFYGS